MQPLYEVRISKRASLDILAIHQYIRQRSPQNADEMVDRIFKAIDDLEFLPHRFKIYQQARRQDLVVRSMPFAPYVIYYQVLESDFVVRILAVRHGARQQPKRFN